MKKRNKIIFILLFIIIMVMNITVLAANQVILLGDVDKNGKIDEEDIKIIINRIANNKEKGENESNTEEDINKDGKVDIVDLLKLMRYKKAKEEGKNDSDWVKSLEEEVILEFEKDIYIGLHSNNAQEQAKVRGKNYGENLTYTIEDENIATVNNDGVVTGKSKGTTTLRVRESRVNLEAACKVTITDKESDILLDKNEAIIDLGENAILQLNAILIGEQDRIVWITDNPEIADVNSNGLVTAKKNGEVTITARNQYGEANCKITVQTNPRSVAIEPRDLIQLGSKETKQLSVVFEPNNADIQTTLTWTSSNENVAVVNEQGLVEAKGVGTAAITVTTSNNKTSTVQIIVKDDVAPIVTIKRIDPYAKNEDTKKENYIVAAGSTVEYEINIEDDNLRSFDINKVKLEEAEIEGEGEKIDGEITKKPSLEVTKIEDKKYKAAIRIPENIIGRLGIVVEEGAAIDEGNNTSEQARYHSIKDYIFSLNTTTAHGATSTDGRITAAVGVHNSFYIKNIEFCLDGVRKVGNRTTNEYIYTGLENDKEYTVRVRMNIYKDKETDDTVEGYIEKKVKVEKNDGVGVHYIGVSDKNGTDEAKGSVGDSMFIKTATGKTIMIDTGRDSGGGFKDQTPTIDKYIRKNKKLVKEDNNGVVHIDYLILTHEHGDHVAGFESLTGIHYDEGQENCYKIDEKNKINGDTVRYEFGKIVLGCTAKKYNKATVANSVATQKNKAIYLYAKTNNKLITVTAGNVLKIDNIVLNIFYPYNPQDVPKKWLYSYINKEKEPIGGIRSPIQMLKPTETRQTKNSIFEGAANDTSVVVKLICGSTKTLFMGDAMFLTEEILLGIPAQQIANKNSELKNGLPVKSSNGAQYNDSETLVARYSLVYDLMNRDKDENGKRIKYSNIEQLEQKYKISRLTKKDLSAQILKKGHHHFDNTTSIPLLKAVEPKKIISTGYKTNRGETDIECVDAAVSYRIREYQAYYYKKYPDANKDTTKNCRRSVFGTETHGNFCIKTENGRGWDYTEPFNTTYGKK